MQVFIPYWASRVSKVSAALIALIVGLGPAKALADKSEAKAHIQRAQEEVAQGRYEAAIEEFQLAYTAFPSPQFLFNIAQIQRKNLEDCQGALVSYRYFLSEGPFEGEALQSAAKVARKHEALLAQQCTATEEDSEELLDAYPVAVSSTSPVTAPPSPTYGYGFKPLPSVVRIDGGGSQYVLGDVDIPFTGSVGASYAFGFGPGVLQTRILASIGLSPMRYLGVKSGVAYFVPALVGVEFVSASEGVVVIGSLQGGILGIAGLSDGNPMTADGKGASTLWSGALRARVAIEVPMGSRWALTFGAEAGVASAPDGLAKDIGSISNLGGSAGISRVL